MVFNSKQAVVNTAEWVIRHSREYKAIRDQGPPFDAFLAGEKAHQALEKANALDTLFLQ